MNLSTINPMCFGGAGALALGILFFAMARNRQTLYVSIPANVDPLDEGVDGWRGLAGRIARERLKRTMMVWGVMAAFIMLVSAAWNPAKRVYAALQPTATPTVTPTMTVTATPTVTVTPASSPTPQVIYIVITPFATITEGP